MVLKERIKKYKYERLHVCRIHCSPIQGIHDFSHRELVRVGKNGKLYHISYDREKIEEFIKTL